MHLRPSDARRVPWKNGRGFTDELALWPRNASFERADFHWRISKAAVEESGPFSAFPGFERVLVVTRGEGLVLDHGNSAPRARVERLVPYRFSGDWPTNATLIDGRIEDFNVLCRRGSARAEVELWTDGAQRSVAASGGEHVFVHFLASGASLWIRPGAARGLALPESGTAILVRIQEIRSHPAT